MKPTFTVLTDSILSDEVFVVKEIKLPVFSKQLHFHEECQLVYVVKSSGKKIIGDSIEDFESDELIFLGSKTPHVWHNTLQENQEELTQAHSLALYINPTRLISQLSTFGKLSTIESFLARAQRGIEFKGESKKIILQKLMMLFNQEGLPQIITFLGILNDMATAEDIKLLASIDYENYQQTFGSKRLDRVFKYIFENFKEDISLQVISEIASMNPSSFCRYFKNNTQKSFTQFLNEARISHACKLLSNQEFNITDIGYESGFNNSSYFYKSFKSAKGMSPKEYRNLLLDLH